MDTEIDGRRFDVGKIRARLERIRLDPMQGEGTRAALIVADELIGALLKERYIPPQPAVTRVKVLVPTALCACGIPKQRCPAHKQE